MPKIAVVLSGCGRMDGSEVHESTLSLLYLAKGGAAYQCFAPDAPQVAVVNHLSNKPMDETRNQMIEAARIARGAVRPLSEASAADWDALVLPGGSGAFANLGKGEGELHPDLRRLIVAFADARKPIAAICIAPLLVGRAIGDRGVQLTLGTDPDSAARLEKTGVRHVPCAVDSCIADPEHRLVSTPAYMLGPGIADVAAGIEACIKQLLVWCG